MELLHELESQADEIIAERMRQTIADALSSYKPMRGRVRCGDGAPTQLRANSNHKVRRDEAGHSGISLRRLRRDARRYGKLSVKVRR